MIPQTSVVLERRSCPLAARILQKLKVTGFPQSFKSCNSPIWKTRLVSLMSGIFGDNSQVPALRLLVDLRDKQQRSTRSFKWPNSSLANAKKVTYLHKDVLGGGFPSAFHAAILVSTKVGDQTFEHRVCCFRPLNTHIQASWMIPLG